MNKESLIDIWKHEEQQPFSGWDFSYLNGRMLEQEPDWSYPTRAAELLKQSSSVVDLDTGGGERFLELHEYWPNKVVASEGYLPNFKLATEKLNPFSVKVVNIQLTDFASLPFDNGEFDLVLNRHSVFNSNEVARVLALGGSFLTQQVHGLWAHDLLTAFDVGPKWPDSTPGKYLPRLKSAGLEIVNFQEWSGQITFTDVGAIIYYLKAVPWLVPGFSVDSHLKYLLNLQNNWKIKTY